MALLVSPQPGRLRHAAALEVRVGGAESNVAIALSRLGIAAGWVGWLGDDEFGELVLLRVRGEGVDTTMVRRVADAPTGLYLRERLGASVRSYYYRAGSAASRMGAGAFPADYLDGARFLHLTGVTPALSERCRSFVSWALSAARERGVKVSYDVNFRSKLWAADDAREFTEGLLGDVGLLFVSAEEARALWGQDDEALLAKLAAHGPEEVVLKRGDEGAVALVGGEHVSDDGFDVDCVDPIGAGDAFAAGYLAGRCWERPAQERVRLANAMGALSVRSPGDYEGLPGADDLEAFLSGRDELGR